MTPKMFIYRVMQSRPEFSHYKPVAHYQNKQDAMKVAQELLSMADKSSWYFVDSVEAY